jgi:hypothetical protein
MRYLRVTVITALLALPPGMAFAQTSWDVLQRFGWTGTWSMHCDQPLSATNPNSVIYLGSDGQVYRKLVRGAGYDDLFSVVVQAQPMTTTTIHTLWRNSTGWTGTQANVTMDMVVAMENSQVRTIESKGSDGKEYIKDGVITLNNNPAPWMAKCGN